MGEAKKRGTEEERVAKALSRKGSIVIMSPFTGRPLDTTPAGLSLKDVTFQTRDEAWQFICEHWENPVEMRDSY